MHRDLPPGFCLVRGCCTQNGWTECFGNRSDQDTTWNGVSKIVIGVQWRDGGGWVAEVETQEMELGLRQKNGGSGLELQMGGTRTSRSTRMMLAQAVT